MKRVIGLIIIAGLVATGSSVVSAQSFESTVYNDQLDVTGKVLPVHSVIINNDGEITRIYSNTTEDVEPRIYRNAIGVENRVDLTDKLKDEYRTLVPVGSSKVGTLYDKSTEQASVQTMLNHRVSSILPSF